QIDGNFVGLGVEIKDDGGELLVVSVLPDSPAQDAGLVAGDRIVAIAGVGTSSLGLDRAVNRLAGPAGSAVTIEVRSAGRGLRRLTLRRRPVEVHSVTESRLVDPSLGIAYIRLASFQKTTSQELDAALWRLHRKGMRGLILDMRGNPGGLLTSAVEVSDKFVQRGAIVSTRGRAAGQSWRYSAQQGKTWNVPLVVLIDGDSASASEIVAACIRDQRRGTLVGRTTYGKGSVQTIFPLQSVSTGLRLTTARFYSPSGHPLDHVGVQPDVVVEQSAYRGAVPSAQLTAPFGASRPTQEGESSDPQLSAAVRVARQQLARR
ncbi:MAG: S41 family peptidase, partial [Pirellulales bacterium]